MVQQYHYGRNNSLNYRVFRRAAHNTDADVASLISTLVTEPEFDPMQKNLAFEFLCLNHTFISYIAALGAHRNLISDPEVLTLLDQALNDIKGALLHDQMPGPHTQDLLKSMLKQLNQSDDPSSEARIILQQLSLMFAVLPQLSTLKQSLSHDPNDQISEFSPV